MRRFLLMAIVAGAIGVLSSLAMSAGAKVPENCTKSGPTVTCTTTSTTGPGKNQGGVGSTTESTTTAQGNVNNKETTTTSSTCNPPKSNGVC
jgi:hypothetical protein